MFGASLKNPGRTWVKIRGSVYGARPDRLGPLGGGRGYKRIVRKGSHNVSTLDELLDALRGAKSGDIVFIDGGAEIDCTERVHIEKLVLEIPAGVTLAGNRGEGASQGALIHSDTFATNPLIRVGGPGVRITGLRLRGPDPKPRLEHHSRSFDEGRGHEYYYKFPISTGIRTEEARLEVDNCELAGWSHGAMYLVGGDGHHVHHNFIHHNQLNGLGYGVCHNKSFSLIEQNLFNYNRHSIAGTGAPGSGYEARNNVELGQSLSHCFDMHGGSDRKDGTDIAGTWIKVHHNTFRARKRAVVIRGLPQEGADVSRNWFCRHGSEEEAVATRGNTRIHNNACGRTRPAVGGAKASR